MKFHLSVTYASGVAACALFLGTGGIQAQVTPGPGGVPAGPNPIVGTPPTPSQGGSTSGQPLPGQAGQGSSIIGQPVPGQSKPVQPVYPSTPSTGGSDPIKDRLDRANKEAADLNRDGLISPEEATRMPPGTPLPR